MLTCYHGFTHLTISGWAPDLDNPILSPALLIMLRHYVSVFLQPPLASIISIS